MKFMSILFVFISLVALSQCLSVPQVQEDLSKHAHKSDTMCKGRFNGTILSDATDCRKFYVCVKNQPQVYNCDANFHFDKNSQTCMAGSDCNGLELEIPSVCTDGTINAVVDDCYVFDACVNGQYQKINCPSGQYFYAPLSMCRPIHYNENFKCNCVLPEHTVMENHDNCQTYYLCESKKAMLQQCPLGQYYNSTINACLQDLEGVCLMEPTKTPMVRIKTEVEKLIETGAKAACERLGSSQEVVVFQPFDSDCDKFYVCANGQLHAQECPKNFYYDTAKKFCVMDSENICQNGKLMTAEDQPQQSQSTNAAVNSKTPVISEFVIPHVPQQGHKKLFYKFMQF